MTEKQKYVGAFLDGYFLDKKNPYGCVFFTHREYAEKQAKKKWKQYKKHKL